MKVTVHFGKVPSQWSVKMGWQLLTNGSLVSPAELLHTAPSSNATTSDAFEGEFRKYKIWKVLAYSKLGTRCLREITGAFENAFMIARLNFEPAANKNCFTCPQLLRSPAEKNGPFYTLWTPRYGISLRSDDEEELMVQTYWPTS